MKESMHLVANAKINLTLCVGGKRPDGYHSLRSIMAPISLSDTITLKRSDAITCECSRPLPLDDNIATKAARLFFEKTGINGGVSISIKKRIPVSAGMAGGSTDAAAVLRGLNEMFDADLSEKELCELGVMLGADVPFCLLGRPCLAEGIGEILTPISIKRNIPLVVTIGDEVASTRSMFETLDKYENRTHPSDAPMLEALKQGNLKRISSFLNNDFELCYGEGSSVAESKTLLLENGAIGALMSGSGTSVFGIFPNYRSAVNAVNGVRKNNRFGWYCTTL